VVHIRTLSQLICLTARLLCFEGRRDVTVNRATRLVRLFVIEKPRKTKKITIHDSGYKHLFSNKVIFRQLIETFVTEAWVKDLDFETCQKIDKSFISEHYKATESDIIYQVKFRSKESYLIILVEFQSTVPRFMALRVLN